MNVNRRDFNSGLMAILGASASAVELPGFANAESARPSPPSPSSSFPGPPKLENQFRGYIVDHHSPDPPAITYSRFDPDQWLQLFEESDLDHYWVFCKGHHGEAYYPTKVGHMHPGLTVDFVQTLSERIRRKGIAFHAYYCIGFDDWAVLNHPEWALLDEEGKNRRVDAKENWHSMGQWRWACVNTPYRQYVMKQLTEIFQGYHPDGLFLDIVGQPLCYCHFCSSLYRARYGYEIPRGAAAERYRKETDEFLYATTQLGFVRDAITTVRALSSRAAITINGGHLKFRSELMDLLDYTFAEPFAGNYLSAMFARGTGKLPQIGPGLVAWPYDPSPDSVFKVESAMIAAQNCRVFMYSETMHQDGTLDPLWFREMGAGYREIEKIKPYLLERDPVPCVAILFSEKTRVNDRLDLSGILKGAMEASAYSQFPSDILPDWKLTEDELKKYQVVVLPEVSSLSGKEAAVLGSFVESGGLLIATGLTGTRKADGEPRPNFVLADIFGCDFEQVFENYKGNLWGSYLKRSGDEFWNALPQATLAVEAPFVVVKPRSGAKVLATHILPSTPWRRDTGEDEQAWVNWEPPPPGGATDFPALVEMAHGRGRAIYAGFDLYGMAAKNYQWPLDWHYRLMCLYLKTPPLRVELANHHGIGVTFYKRRQKSEVIVHQVNRTISLLNGDVNSLSGGTLIVSRSFFNLSTCRQVYPEQRDLEIAKQGSFAQVKLPNVDVHSVVVLGA